MRKWILAAALAAIAAPAFASDKSDIEAAINGYNKEFSPKFCAAQTGIIDEFGQHAWTSCSDWINSFNAEVKAESITDPVVTIKKPSHLQVDGDYAYAVYPAKYDYKVKGKVTHEKGMWTFALHKQSGAWLITAWTWSHQ